jgi:hypothetical protein
MGTNRNDGVLSLLLRLNDGHRCGGVYRDWRIAREATLQSLSRPTPRAPPTFRGDWEQRWEESSRRDASIRIARAGTSQIAQSVTTLPEGAHDKGAGMSVQRI